MFLGNGSPMRVVFLLEAPTSTLLWKLKMLTLPSIPQLDIFRLKVGHMGLEFSHLIPLPMV